MAAPAGITLMVSWKFMSTGLVHRWQQVWSFWQKRSHRERLGILIVAIVMLLVASSCWSCWQQGNQEKVQQSVLVRSQKVKTAIIDSIFTYAGEVRSRQERHLSFQVGGKVKERYVEVGSRVQIGELLLVMDDRDLVQDGEARAAQVAAAQSQLILASENLKRYQQLYTLRAISQSQLDEYKAAYDSATAALQLAVAQNRQAENRLEYSRLCAEQAGVVSAIVPEAGQVVTPGQPVVTVIAEGEPEVEIHVPENHLSAMQDADFQIRFWALPGAQTNGKVREISPMADSLSHLYKVRIRILEVPPGLQMGMSAEVILQPVAKQTKLWIPLAAIYQIDGKTQVWVVQEGCVYLRHLELGKVRGEQIEVRQGLKAGERIVTAGIHKLREGQAVRLQEEEE